MENGKVHFRADVRKEDRSAVREIVESTGFFHNYEVDTAEELVDERLKKGAASGYYFIFAELEGKTVGYCCYGPIACTAGSYDLYWIAIHNDCRNKGIGRVLIKKTEEAILLAGGKRIFVETSSQPKYESTRKFYEKFNYIKEAEIRDFYDDNDNKVLYVKKIG